MKVVRSLIVIVATMVLFSASSQAAGPRRRVIRPAPRPAPRRVVRALPPGAHRMVVGGVPYWAHGGLYYKVGDGGYVVVSAPLLKILPRHHRVVVIRGSVYYVVDGVYYRSAPGGYVVVETPVEKIEVAAEPAPPVPASREYTLYVPKRTGEGFASVTLKKLDGGYLGPQGEFYPSMPPVALLTEMYGVAAELRQVRSDTFFIHVPNKDGQSFTRVTLTRHQHGFLGPQGEFYPLMPSVAHLAELYGAGETPAEPAEIEVRLQVPRQDGQGCVEVILKKHERGYLGPQGEFYPDLPSTDHLAEIYGGD